MASPAATVLIADDTRATARALGELMANAGLGVEFAADGPEALRRACESGIDLVLLDLAMPGLDGLQLLRLLRAREERRHVPVLVITVRQDDSVRLAALQLGADDVLEKPWNVEVLLARVRRCLELKAERDALEQRLAAVTKGPGGASREEGLLEATQFEARVREELRRAQRYSDPLALILVDISSEKAAAATAAIDGALRRAVRETDLLGRLNGGRFGALLPKTSLAGGLTAAERMLGRLRDTRRAGEPPGSISLGIAGFPNRMLTGFDPLWRAAEQALSQARREGGDRIRLFSPPVAAQPASSAENGQRPDVPSPRSPGRF